jgi:hypothetical protein
LGGVFSESCASWFVNGFENAAPDGLAEHSPASSPFPFSAFQFFSSSIREIWVIRG